MSNNKQEIVNARPDRLVKETKVKVPLALSALQNAAKLPLTDDSSSIGEPIVIAITSGNVHQIVTVHRPVGFHDLGSSDWVGTPISECSALLSAAVNPTQGKLDEKLRIARTDRAIELQLYLKGADGVVRYPPKIHSGDAIASVATQVTKTYEAAKKQAFDDYIADCEHRNTKPKKDWKFGMVRASFIPEEVAAYDKAVSKALSADVVMREKVKTIDPHPYRTLNGPRGNVEQVAVKTPREHTRDQMVDVIRNDLMTTFSGHRLLGGIQGASFKQEWDSAKATLGGCVSFVEKYFPSLKPTVQPPEKTAADTAKELADAEALITAAKKLAT